MPLVSAPEERWRDTRYAALKSAPKSAARAALLRHIPRGCAYAREIPTDESARPPRRSSHALRACKEKATPQRQRHAVPPLSYGLL